MRRKCATQSLSYPIRLPDVVQADALRLLDVSREVINETVSAPWDRLDAFGKRESTYAYKQVTAMIGSRDPHGDRQWRCEAEQAGRILILIGSMPKWPGWKAGKIASRREIPGASQR